MLNMNLFRVKKLLTGFCIAWLMAAGGVAAQTGSLGPSAQPLHVLVGKSVIITSQTRLNRVLASNSEVISAVVVSPEQVVVEAKKAGSSSLIVWDEAGVARMFDVSADLDLSGFRTALEHAYPHYSIRAQADGDHIILSGAVTDARDAADIVKMGDNYSKSVVNSLTIEPPRERQIMLAVKFAEVDRTRLRQLGINIFSTGATNTVGTIGTQQFGTFSGGGNGGFKITDSAPGTGTTEISPSSLLNIFLFRHDIHLGAVIQDLEQKQVLEILAEPNLMAMDGAKASFLAGGEFPYPVVQGGQNIGTVTIQFRPYGVKLEFEGHIDSDNTIHLHIAPEVSALDYTNSVTISGFTVPAFSTRRAETDIELRDGQSFGIAGLLDQRTTAQLSKMPGIGDIPILGLLFKSKSVQKSNTDLMVLVTPHIIDPVQSGVQQTAVPAPAIPFMNKPRFDTGLPNDPPAQSPATTPHANDSKKGH